MRIPARRYTDLLTAQNGEFVKVAARYIPSPTPKHAWRLIHPHMDPLAWHFSGVRCGSGADIAKAQTFLKMPTRSIAFQDSHEIIAIQCKQACIDANR